VIRAVVILSIASLCPAVAGAQTSGISFEELAALSAGARSAELARIRDSDGGVPRLREFEMAARQRADTRRAHALPPRSEGCLTADEFDLDWQLKLARQSEGGAQFAQSIGQFRQLAGDLDAKLAEARRTNLWRRQFPSLRNWEREWRAAKDPRVRELMLRTLNGQAIRAALARTRQPAPVRAVAKGQSQPSAPRASVSALAESAYREYVFNLMCANDEENLDWFKRQVAEIGWFGQKQYGWAADQAALLIVQHADADPGFQESVVAALWPRLEVNDTDPENFAYLVDRVAVHSGRPQSFGTQMECVNGAWIVPEIQDHDTLDSRRKRMNLVAYDVQLARTRGLCRD